MKEQVGKSTDTLESLRELGIEVTKVAKCCCYSRMVTQLLVDDCDQRLINITVMETCK